MISHSRGFDSQFSFLLIFIHMWPAAGRLANCFDLRGANYTVDAQMTNSNIIFLLILGVSLLVVLTPGLVLCGGECKAGRRGGPKPCG